jgi:hypothetical protein
MYVACNVNILSCPLLQNDVLLLAKSILQLFSSPKLYLLILTFLGDKFYQFPCNMTTWMCNGKLGFLFYFWSVLQCGSDISHLCFVESSGC